MGRRWLLRPEAAPAGSGSLLPALCPGPFLLPLALRKSLQSPSLLQAYSAFGGRPKPGRGTGQELRRPAPGAESPIRGKLAASPRQCPWQGGSRRSPAPSSSLFLPPGLAAPDPPDRPQTSRKAPETLCTGTGPGASEGTGRLPGTFEKTEDPLRSLGRTSVSLSAAEMHPPKSFPKPCAS